MEMTWSHYSARMRTTRGDSEWNCDSVLEDAESEMRAAPPFALNINNVPSVKETLHLNWKQWLNRCIRHTGTCCTRFFVLVGGMAAFVDENRFSFTLPRLGGDMATPELQYLTRKNIQVVKHWKQIIIWGFKPMVLVNKTLNFSLFKSTCFLICRKRCVRTVGVLSKKVWCYRIVPARVGTGGTFCFQVDNYMDKCYSV